MLQGTNAHAILGKHLDAAASPPASFSRTANWQHARHWVLPAAHPLVCHGSVSAAGKDGAPRLATAECNLLAPRLALFADHVVFGRALFPGAGMLEAVLAAGTTALDSNSSSSSRVLAVAALTISSPVILPARFEHAARGVLMRCSLNPATGATQLTQTDRHNTARSIECANGSLVATLPTAIAVQAAATAAAAAVAMRRVLLGRALSVAAGHTTGTIVAHSRVHTDGYLVPPPCMDACLHLGVALPGCGIKVPVALGAFLLAAQLAAPSAELEGSTSAPYALPAGSTDVSSFALRTASGGAFASCANLETKVSKTSGQLGSGQVKAAEFLYEVDWHAACYPAADSTQRAPEAWLALSSTAASMGLAAGPHQAAVSAMVVVVQAQTARAPEISATLPALLPSGLMGTAAGVGGKLLAAGAVEGLLRVAAAEHVSTAFTLTSAEAFPSECGVDVIRHTEKGILNTTRIHASIACMARLLPRQVVQLDRFVAPGVTSKHSCTSSHCPPHSSVSPVQPCVGPRGSTAAGSAEATRLAGQPGNPATGHACHGGRPEAA